MHARQELLLPRHNPAGPCGFDPLFCTRGVPDLRKRGPHLHLVADVHEVLHEDAALRCGHPRVIGRAGQLGEMRNRGHIAVLHCVNGVAWLEGTLRVVHDAVPTCREYLHLAVRRLHLRDGIAPPHRVTRMNKEAFEGGVGGRHRAHVVRASPEGLQVALLDDYQGLVVQPQAEEVVLLELPLDCLHRPSCLCTNYLDFVVGIHLSGAEELVSLLDLLARLHEPLLEDGIAIGLHRHLIGRGVL
mmetsp:Transcript_63472/g.175954  ORF Transcript_63472/g.175954 Transcript_63472/m.175954 type:complete len:244 (+) Transcript_63472:1648-2379(+)